MPAIRPNAGYYHEYRVKLDDMIREIRGEINALIAKYSTTAMDALDEWLPHAIDLLMIEWLGKLNNDAQPLAEEVALKSMQHYDRRVKSALKKKGFTVELQLTDNMEKAIRGAIGENVGLIRSIPSRYLSDVSKYVWASVEGGFDMQSLTDNLEHAYHISRDNAKRIAYDQTNKIHGVMEQARRMDLGITRAVWLHSSAAKKPRKSHQAANGKEFKVAEGMLIDGEYILPSQKINCGCVSKSVLDI